MARTRSRLSRRLRIAAYRINKKFERTAPLWTTWLPTWGISVAIHGLLVVVMALVYFAQPTGDSQDTIRGEFEPHGPLGEDLTSLVAAHRAGDPFETSKTNDFPSFGIGTPDPTKITAQPKMPDGTKFSSTISLSGRNMTLSNVKLTDTVGQARPANFHVEDLSAPFSGRDPMTKAALIRRQGGTVESEKAVTAGLEWLARHQSPDGSWHLDVHGQCQGQGCPVEPAMYSDVAATGLAILPMLGAGHSHMKEGRYQESIRRGLTWLIKQQKRDGELFLGGGGNTKFYTHAIGTMALCEAYGLTKDPKLRIPAQRGLNYIAKMQNVTDGGWRYFQGQPGDTSVFGWQIFALRSGRLAGLTTPKRVAAGCNRYLDLAQSDDQGITYGYLPGSPPNPVMTAEGLLCRQYLGWGRDHPSLRAGSQLVAANLRESQQRNIYYWYYATQMLHNMQDKDWKEWNTRVRDGLVAMQVNGQGCDRGSWDPRNPEPDVQGLKAGRLYTTALSVLTLEVYYRFLPLYKVVGEGEGLDEAKEKEVAAEVKKSDK